MRPPPHTHRSQRVSPGGRRPTVAIRTTLTILAIALLLVLITACSGTTAKVTSTATPFLRAGQMGIILSTVSLGSKSSPSTQAPSSKLSVVGATDGKLVWSKGVDGTIANVVVASGTLFVGVASPTSSSAFHTTLLALRLADGSQVWTQTSDSAQLPLAAGNGALYIAAVAPGTQQIQVQALQESDGHPLWTVPLPGTPAGAMDGTGGPGATLDGATLYLPLRVTKQTKEQQLEQQFQLVALRTSDGMTLWTTSPSGLIFASVVSAGTIYAQSVGVADPTSHLPPPVSILAWRGSDGMQLWNHPLDAGAVPTGFSGLVASADTLFMTETMVTETSGPPASQLIALDAKTGAQRWRVDAGGAVSALCANGSALYASAVVYNPLIPSSVPTATLGAYSVSAGKQLWTQVVPNGMAQRRCEASLSSVYLPVLTKKTSEPEQLTSALDAWNASDGTLEWTYSIDGYVSAWLAAVA